jgi:catechol 2,3-dioxygenase-like lactoylglutathione lyase family enzyme
MSFSALGGLNGNPKGKEPKVSTSTGARITEIGRVMVPVSDQQRALDFYVGTLGFEKRMDVPYGNGDRWIEVAPPGTATAIALVPPRQGDPVGVETRISLSTDDAGAAHAALSDRGVDVDPEVMRMGGPVPPMFFFRDQDGNSLLLVETP